MVGVGVGGKGATGGVSVCIKVVVVHCTYSSCSVMLGLKSLPHPESPGVHSPMPSRVGPPWGAVAVTIFSTPALNSDILVV